MGNLSGKTGFTPVQTRVTLANNGTTNVQDFAAYDGQELTGFVYVDATSDARALVKVSVLKNGAGTYEVAVEDTSGDLLSGAPIVSFAMSGSILQATLPSFTGFVTAYIQYNLNAPFLGGNFPLTVDSSVVASNVFTASTGSGFTFKENGGTTIVTFADNGNCAFGPSGGTGTHTFTGRVTVSTSAAASAVRNTFENTGATGSMLLTLNAVTETYIDFQRSGSSKWQIYNNASGDILTFFSTAVMGEITAAGLWRIGQNGGTQTHLINGQFIGTHPLSGGTAVWAFRNTAAATANSRFEVSCLGTSAVAYHRYLGGAAGTTIKWDVGYLQSTTDSYDWAVGGATTVGSISSTGAWSVGPGGAATALQIQTINGKINNQISNGSLIYRNTGNFTSSNTGATTVLSIPGGAGDSGVAIVIRLRVTATQPSAQPTITDYFATIAGATPSLAVSAGTTVFAGGATAGTFAWSGTNLQYTRGGSTDVWHVDIEVSRRNATFPVTIS